MCFDRSWRKSRHKKLRNYATYRLPNNTEVFLITRLPWLVVIHLIAVALGIRSGIPVPWWLLCMLPLFTVVFLIVVYFRERDNDLVGFFRYSSVFFSLVGISLIELAVLYSIYRGVPSALIGSFLIGLILLALLLLWLRKKIDDNAFSADKKYGSGAAAAGLAGALGYVSHSFCERVFSEQALSALMVIDFGLLAGCMFGLPTKT